MKKTTVIISAVIIAVLVSGLYRCPIKLIFGFDCPGCGMMRAFLSALRLDFASAFAYHPLFPLFGAWAVYVIFREPISSRIKINQKAELALGVVSLSLLVVVWIVRQSII